MRGWRRAGLPLLGVIVLAFVPYRVLFTSRVPSGRDLLFYFFPLKAHLAEALRAGELPWIDRYRWGGVPLLAAPSVAPLDPANVLFVLLPLGTAMKAWMLLHLALGLAGFQRFARRFGLSPEAAAVAALGFGLAGVTVSLMPFLAATSALSILPWFASFVLEVRSEPGRGPMLRLAAATALLLLASIPEFVLYAAIIAASLFLIPLSDPPEKRPAGRALALSLAAALLGAGLASASLVPSMASSSRSIRRPGGGMGLGMGVYLSLPAVRLKELLADGLNADWSVATSHEKVPDYPYLPSVTPGRVALLLALLGIVAGGRRRWAPGGLVAAGLLLAMGSRTPVWTFCARCVPLLTWIRYPEKHVILAGFGFAWLALLGLGVLERRLRPEVARLVLFLLAVAVVVDREPITRRLMWTEPATILTERPEVLRGLPARGPGEATLRLFAWDSYAGPPVPILRVSDAPRSASRSVLPEYGSLFGTAYQFEEDYDLSLPESAWVWSNLMLDAIPKGSTMPLRFLRAAGVAGIVRSEPERDGSYVPKLHLFQNRLPPFRFAGRIVANPDARRLVKNLLDEGFDAGTAYVRAPREGLPEAPSAGTVGRVRDDASALELEVDVPQAGDGYLVLYRLREAVEEATLDGIAVAVDEVAFGFAGLRIPPGRHVLSLRPRTRWVKIGAMLSLASLVAAGLLARGGRREEARGSAA